MLGKAASVYPSGMLRRDAAIILNGNTHVKERAPLCGKVPFALWPQEELLAQPE
jgi:hypothetical protein